MSAAEALKPDVKNVIPLLPNGMERADYARNCWHVTAAFGVPLDAVTQSRYWNQQVQRLNIFDRIEVVAIDGTWYAELLVTDKRDNAAKVEVIHKAYFQASDPTTSREPPEGYEVRWAGPKLRWSVIRLLDNQRMKSDFPNESDAVKYIHDMVKAVA